jgi:hypothetical protein
VRADIFASSYLSLITARPQRRNHLAACAFQIAHLTARFAAGFQGIQMNKTKVTSVARLRGSRPFIFAGVASALALLCVPHPGHGQGIVRGAQEGSYEGSRVAGPVGGVVGGAVGAGVGGAVGAVEGVFGAPRYYWRHHCHGFYDRAGYYHCYR